MPALPARRTPAAIPVPPTAPAPNAPKRKHGTFAIAALLCLALATAPLAGIAQEPSPDARYRITEDAKPQPGVPEGKVHRFELADSKVYPGYIHDWWLYVPAQYDGKTPIALMVFQDGEGYATREGGWRVPIVFNNLIARGEIPVMAAIFINPGRTRRAAPDGSPLRDASNRSVEYDTLNADYTRFLLEEIIPQAREHVKITDDPEGRAIAGHSSGGICAFTVAWQRPDQFRKVHSANGSFTNIRGGHVYPDLVRNSPKKPIRIWQQAGAQDMVHPEWGNWADANQAMAAALKAKGYDHQFHFGTGTHSPAHAISLFPEALRWLWRDYRPRNSRSRAR